MSEWVVLLILINIHLPCRGQYHIDSNPYITQNYNQLGVKYEHQINLPQQLSNLKGDIKSITHDGYDKRGLYMGFESTPEQSYKYVFNQDHSIKELWLYSNRDAPSIKKIYHSFIDNKLLYYMKFHALGKLETSTTFKYNNRNIGLGAKTTTGLDLIDERFEISKIGDTTIIKSNAKSLEYTHGRLITRFTFETWRLEEFEYYDNGKISVWTIGSEDYGLIEAIEFDTLGRMVEWQKFETSSPFTHLVDHKEQSFIKDELILYRYNERGFLSEEEHRFLNNPDSNYKIFFEYDENNVVIRKQYRNQGEVARDLKYTYNNHGDLTNITNAVNNLVSLKVEYSEYDEYNNWTVKLSRNNTEEQRVVRRIEYYE